MAQRILFIINPISGTTRKGNVVKAIERRIDTQRFAVELRYTEYAGHAVEIARSMRWRALWCTPIRHLPLYPLEAATDWHDICSSLWT